MGIKKKAGIAILISDKIDFETKDIKRGQEGPMNFTSLYLSKETQNMKLKRCIHSYVHCSIIYNSQYMEAT